MATVPESFDSIIRAVLTQTEGPDINTKDPVTYIGATLAAHARELVDVTDPTTVTDTSVAIQTIAAVAVDQFKAFVSSGVPKLKPAPAAPTPSTSPSTPTGAAHPHHPHLGTRLG